MLKPGYVAAFLSLAAAALFVSGAWLHWGNEDVPRVTVLSGTVHIDDNPATINSRLPGGASLTISGQNGAVTLQSADGDTLTLSGVGRLTYQGRTRYGRAYVLDHGRLFVRRLKASGDLTVTSALGTIQAKDAVFEVLATALQTGIAIDTPRITRLSVGKGTVRIAVAGHPDQREFVPAGVKAEIREGTDRILASEWLSPQEWKQMIGHRPRFADAGTPADQVPSGVWIPRRPGRRGPTPGSHSGREMRCSGQPGGAVLHSGEDRYWRYIAAEDRWRRAKAGEFPAKRDATKTPPPPPGAEGAIAYSRRAGAFLFYGRVKGMPGTWVRPKGADRWQQVSSPANPPPRVRHALCYDAKADLFVLSGGDAHGRALDDLWIFRLGPNPVEAGRKSGKP